MKIDKRLFNEFMNLYWLRPENATTMYFQSHSWQNINLKNFKNKLDLCCGDGTYIFLHCGGEFKNDFDFFINTSAEKFSHDKFTDIYNFNKKLGSTILFLPSTRGASRERQGRGRVRQIRFALSRFAPV